MGRIFDLEKFKQESSKVHNGKYDYSHVHETRTHEGKTRSITTLKIICPTHGAFWQSASNHRLGRGCAECGKAAVSQTRQDSTKSFVKKAKTIHDTKYDYSHVVYVDSKSNVEIKCRDHGIFEQRPNNHLSGKGCPTCAIEARPEYKVISKRELLKSDLQIVSKLSNGIHHATLVEVRCDVHGEFTVKASSAVAGCFLCRRSRTHAAINVNSRAEFQVQLVQDILSLYGDQFDCSLVEYKDAKTAVRLVCKDHGEFKASPNRITGGKSTGNVKASPCYKCRATGTIKCVTIGGKEFGVRGYEAHAIRFLVEEKGIAPGDIAVGSEVPRIPIHIKKTNGHISRQHQPDLYIKSRNLIIEVKSTATFGLTPFYGSKTDHLRSIRHKSRRAKALGYDYRVMLFAGQKQGVKRLPLPSGWDTWTLKQIREWFKSLALS